MAVALADAKPKSRSKVTFEEFIERSEGKFSEWVDGKVVPMSADTMHQKLVQFLSHLVAAFAETRSGGTVLTAPALMRLRHRPSGREPDVMYVAKENEGRVLAGYVDGPADLAVEVVSTQSRVRDRREKYYEYAKAGVREYWLVDPEMGTVEFFRLGEDGAYYPIAPGEGGKLRSVVLEGLAIDPQWLLGKPLPPVIGVMREIGII